jgi:hypothetical protein
MEPKTTACRSPAQKMEKIERLSNAAAAVDSNDTIYVGEVNGTNVKK